MNDWIGQGKGTQQPDGRQQPAEAERVVAQLLPEEFPERNHQQYGNTCHDIGFNQKIENIHGTHSITSLPHR